MEYFWNLFNSNSTSLGSGVSGHGTSCGGNSNAQGGAGAFDAPWTHQGEKTVKGPFNYNPDPHLTCLKLGKRQYVPGCAAGTSPTRKKEKFYDPGRAKPVPPASVPAVAPRCQVEGCQVLLLNAKDYHRRHKVCEKHTKAPKVVVLGIEQRFCQQCSRFHKVDEFDESKRSCRRRLAGHNERRRKSSQEHYLAKNSVQELKMMAASRNTNHFSNSGECALSLLSSSTNQNPPTWNISSSSDLPARCSAALQELIAENRASVSASGKSNLIFNSQTGNAWNQNESNLRFLNSSSLENGEHLTLGRSAFGMLSVHDYGNNSTKLFKGGSDQQECSELWRLPLGY